MRGQSDGRVQMVRAPPAGGSSMKTAIASNIRAEAAASPRLGAGLIGQPFLLAGLSLVAMGVLYNAPPLRTKDKAYLDVLSESVNNPIRFLLGWFAVTGATLPPASALLAYWMGGAFLMAIKRYSEYRGIADPARAALYRRSFAHYSELSLLWSGFCFALCSAFFP